MRDFYFTPKTILLPHHGTQNSPSSYSLHRPTPHSKTKKPNGVLFKCSRLNNAGLVPGHHFPVGLKGSLIFKKGGKESSAAALSSLLLAFFFFVPFSPLCVYLWCRVWLVACSIKWVCMCVDGFWGGRVRGWSQKYGEGGAGSRTDV